MLGIASWGLWSFVLKMVLQRGMDFYRVTILSSVGVLLLAVVVWLIFADSVHSPTHLTGVSLALLGGAIGGVSQLTYIAALERGPASIIVPLYALSPSVTVGLSLVLLGERLKPMQWVGVFVAFMAALVMGRKEGTG